jgi:hypothetical protein
MRLSCGNARLLTEPPTPHTHLSRRYRGRYGGANDRAEGNWGLGKDLKLTSGSRKATMLKLKLPYNFANVCAGVYRQRPLDLVKLHVRPGPHPEQSPTVNLSRGLGEARSNIFLGEYETKIGPRGYGCRSFSRGCKRWSAIAAPRDHPQTIGLRHVIGPEYRLYVFQMSVYLACGWRPWPFAFANTQPRRFMTIIAILCPHRPTVSESVQEENTPDISARVMPDLNTIRG